MSFTTLPTMAQDDPIDVDYLNQIKTNLDDHESRLSAIGAMDIPNGGFEVDSDADGDPDNWVAASFTGGSRGLYTTDPASGAKARYHTHPGGAGNGGGYDYSDYVPCSPKKLVVIEFETWSTNSAMNNIMRLWWYKKDKTASSTTWTAIWASTTNPSTATRYVMGAIPPSDASFFKVQIIGGDSSVDQAGTVYWDSVKLMPTTFHLLDQKLLSEQGIANTAYQDAGSFSVDIPTLSAECQVKLRFTGDVKRTTAAADSYQRFRYSTTYSNEGITPSSTYVPFTYEMVLPKGVSGTITLYQQLKTASTSGGNYAWGQKDNPEIEIIIELF